MVMEDAGLSTTMLIGTIRRLSIVGAVSWKAPQTSTPP